MPKVTVVLDVPEADPKFDDPEVLVEVVVDAYMKNCHADDEEEYPKVLLYSAEWVA